MNVAIVGAGMAGLAAGRTLRAAGIRTVLFEKSRGPGGRCATRRREGYVFDSGATSIAPRGRAIEGAMLRELPTEDLIAVQRPIYLHQNLRVQPGDPRRGTSRYVYRGGMRTLGALLAEGLEIRTEASVEGLERSGTGFLVMGEPYDAVILTPPVPQTSLLLWSLGEARPLANARYRPCLSVMLGYAEPLPEVAWWALLDAHQRHALTWLSLESAISPERAPAGGSAVVAQMSPTFSHQMWSADAREIVQATSELVARILGPAFAAPPVSDVMRWKYSQPETLATFEHVNRPGDRLIVAGDGLGGGRLEDAYESGVLAARLLLDR